MDYSRKSTRGDNKRQNEQVQESNTNGPLIKVALATGDFACQNVAMQIGIKLLNAMSGNRLLGFVITCIDAMLVSD